MNSEEIRIKDGKTLLYIVFGANRWEFEKLDESEKANVPEYAQACLTRLMNTVMFLLKNWKRIPAEDRAMGEAALTQEIAGANSCGISIVGILIYGRTPDGVDKRKYNAFLRIVKDG